MGYITKNINIKGTLKDKSVKALFDSGAYRNYIRTIFFDGEDVDELGIQEYFEEKDVILPNNTKIKGRRIIIPSIRIGPYSYDEIEFVMMENLTSDAIIGALFMQENKFILKLEEEEIEIKSDG